MAQGKPFQAAEQVNKELLKGSTLTLILSILKKRPMYGYELIKEMRSLSGGVVAVSEGTLYPLLHGLEKKDLVETVWMKEGGRERRYYRLSREGRQTLKEKQAEWETFRDAVDRVLKGPVPPRPLR